MSPPPPTHPILAQQFASSEIAFIGIDQEIAALYDSIRALRTFRNTFAPVNRLPPEILSRIFSLVRLFSRFPPPLPQLQAFPGIHENDDDGEGLEWILVTGVSQHWRSVAIGSPELWSHISGSYPQPLIKEWLQRSKIFPLSVSSSASRYSQPLDAQFVKTSLFRIQELTLELTTDSWKNLLPSLCYPAPLLTSLSIVINDRAHFTPSAYMGSLFAGMLGSLQHLHLTRCPFDLNLSCIMDLTSLELYDPPQRLSAIALLNILRKSPRLTSLVLAHVLLEDDDPISSNFDTVVLPSVDSLTIKGHSFHQDLDILSHLSIPATSTLKFHSNDTRTLGEVITTLRLAEFLRVDKGARQPSLISTVVDHIDLRCSWNMLTLTMTSGSNRRDSDRRVNHLEFALVGPQRGTTLELPDTPETTTLLSYLPLAGLKSFHTDCALGVGTWTNIFGPLPELKRISATGRSAFNLLSAIVEDAPSYEEKPPTENKANARGKKEEKGRDSRGQSVAWDPILPKLETLQFHDTNFLDRTEDFVAVLRARKMVGKGIKTLKLTQCLNIGNVVDKLRGVVDRVV